MKNSLLLQLVLKLSDKQIREIKKWIRSPFYNHREDVIELFDILIKIKKQGKTVIAKEEAYKKLYPKTAYDDGKIRLVMTFLQKNIEQYLVHQSYEQEATSDIRLATIYRKMNLSKHFERQINKVSKDHEKKKIQNADFYEYQYKIEWERYYHTSMKRRQGDVHLQEVGDYIDIAYYARKLEQACYVISHQTIYKIEYKQALIEEILSIVETEKHYDIPVISIYYHCYQALRKDPESGWFEKFRTELEKHKSLFPEDQLRSLYLLALNFCIRQYNAGNTAYLQEEYNLYKECLEGGYLYIDGYLSRFTYRNFMTVCIAADKLDFAEVFVDAYINKLEAKYQESAYSFNKARLAYHQRAYKDALMLLQMIEYSDFHTQISAKTIMIKIFYETQDWDIFSNYLDNLKTQIYRKKDIGPNKNNYLNFVKYAKKLLQLEVMDKDDRNQLIVDINNESRIAERTWLTEQIRP